MRACLYICIYVGVLSSSISSGVFLSGVGRSVRQTNDFITSKNRYKSRVTSNYIGGGTAISSNHQFIPGFDGPDWGRRGCRRRGNGLRKKMRYFHFILWIIQSKRFKFSKRSLWEWNGNKNKKENKGGEKMEWNKRNTMKIKLCPHSFFFRRWQ